MGEFDLFVGRLEPGDASPDLETEALYTEPMCIVARVGWKQFSGVPWVVPPPWASSRIKLEPVFHRHRLAPPSDIVETASFLATLSFVRERPVIGFLARGVALHAQQEGLVKVLKLAVPIKLPPVGMITLRGRARTPATQQC